MTTAKRPVGRPKNPIILKCRALMRGEIPDSQFGRRIIEQGKEFTLEDPSLFSHRWMEPVDFDPKKVEGIPAPKRFDHGQAADLKLRDQAQIIAMAIVAAKDMLAGETSTEISTS